MASFYGPTSPNGASDGDEWINQTTGERRVFAGGTWRTNHNEGSTANVSRLTPATIAVVGAVTYTGPGTITGGLILRDPNGAGRTDVTPTAAQLVAAVPGVQVNDTLELVLVNTADAAETITVQAGSGVTLVPATLTIAQNEIGRLILHFTNVTPGAEAVAVYGVAVGG